MSTIRPLLTPTKITDLTTQQWTEPSAEGVYAIDSTFVKLLM